MRARGDGSPAPGGSRDLLPLIDAVTPRSCAGIPRARVFDRHAGGRDQDRDALKACRDLFRRSVPVTGRPHGDHGPLGADCTFIITRRGGRSSRGTALSRYRAIGHRRRWGPPRDPREAGDSCRGTHAAPSPRTAGGPPVCRRNGCGVGGNRFWRLPEPTRPIPGTPSSPDGGGGLSRPTAQGSHSPGFSGERAARLRESSWPATSSPGSPCSGSSKQSRDRAFAISRIAPPPPGWPHRALRRGSRDGSDRLRRED